MVRRNLAIALVLLATFSLLAAAGDDKNAGNQTVCPVMGNPINKEVYTDYNLEKMKADGVEPMKLAAQTTCPLTGNPIDKDVFVDHEGMRVYLCCPACTEKFKADPDKYLKVIADKGETPEILKKEEAEKK